MNDACVLMKFTRLIKIARAASRFCAVAVLWIGYHALALAGPAQSANPGLAGSTPVKVIFDTDIGNDIDDVLALGMLHSLQARHQCELLAVTITKPDELAGPFVNAVNSFYGYPDIPIGYTQAHLKNEPSKFLSLVNAVDGGKPRYSHKLRRSADAPPATQVLRSVLAAQPDQSVVLIQVGFFSNLAALLQTAGDATSPLRGGELVKQKVRLLSVMAGSFQPIPGHKRFPEYNVVNDLPAAQQVAKEWPSPIVWSGFEIGIALPYPAGSIEQDFNYVTHHPVAEAYRLYRPPPHERPTWDLTSVLYAVFPDRNYFDVSPPGQVTVADDGSTDFTPVASGRDRFLMLKEQRARVKEALVQLASEPPHWPANRGQSAEGIR